MRIGVKADQRDGNRSKVEFQNSGDHVYIVTLFQDLTGGRPIRFEFVFEVINVVGESGHSIQSLGVQASIFDLLDAVLHDEWPNRIVGLYEGGQIDAEHSTNALRVRTAIVGHFLGTFFMRNKVAILAFHSLTEYAK